MINSTPSDGGDHTETCWSYCNFNLNFNILLKTIPFVHQLEIKTLILAGHKVQMWKFIGLLRILPFIFILPILGVFLELETEYLLEFA